MKYATLTALLLLSGILTAYSQQPTTTRRGLDQIDLLTVPRTSAPVGAPVHVDLETFQLLEPLMRYCRELEQNYVTTVMAKDEPLTPASFATIFRSKADAIQRSLFLIRKIEEPSPQLSRLLDETDLIGSDLGVIAFALHSEEPKDVQREVEGLKKKYAVGDQADLKHLAAAILRRLNANFGRVKIQG